MRNAYTLILAVMLAGCATKQAAPNRAVIATPMRTAALAVSGGYTLFPTSATALAAGGSGTVNLTTPTWTAFSSDPSWLTISPASGSGNATLGWSALANTGPQRSATLTIADQIFTVTQSAGGVVPPTTNEWARSFGIAGSDSGEAVIYDGGNVIVAGQLSGDMFINKYSSSGSLVWSKRYGNSGNEIARTMAQDNAGNILIAGSFSGLCTFGGAVFSSVGDSDAFIAKYSPQGDHVWSITFGSTLSDRITRLAVDHQDNVVVTGDFHTFSLPLTIGTNILVSHSQADVFVAKFNSAGVNVWAKNFFCANPNRGTGIGVDANDNVIVGGYYQGAIDFSSSTAFTGNALTVPGSFLAKFSPVGAYVGSRALGTNFPSSATAMTIDSVGDIVIAGGFYQHTDLGAGQVFGNAFVAKYDANLGYKWSSVIQGNASIGVASLSSDNSIFITGYFNGTAVFGPFSLNAGNVSNNGFVTKYLPTGTPQWARDFGSKVYPNGSNGNAVSGGGPVVTGAFQGTLTLGGSTLSSAGGQDALIWKLNP